MNAVWCQEAIRYPLRKTVFVQRIAEVVVCVEVLLAPRGCRHADLGCGLEPFQNLTPIAVVPRAATVALVDYDEVKEVPSVFAVEAGAILIARDGLVDRKIDVAALDRHAACDFVTCVAERAEILGHRIVDQDVTISKKQYLRVAVDALRIPTCRPELPADLKGNSGLARPGAQGEQRPLPALKRRLNGTVYRDLLIVSKRLCPVWKSGRQQPFGHLIIDDTLSPAKPRP